VASGSGSLPASLANGELRALADLTFTLPASERVLEFRLEAELNAGDRRFRSEWPLWCYPRPPAWPEGVAAYDPPGLFEDMLKDLPIVDVSGHWPYALVITSVLDPPALAFLRGGGRLLLLQGSGGPLPSRRLPFWRESLKLCVPGPFLDGLGRPGFVGYQFLAVATDVALQTDRLAEAIPDAVEVRTIMRRLDAREFHVTDYILEARVGAGRLLACTLKLAGGFGAQPERFEQSVVGQALLQAMVDHLRDQDVSIRYR
jgi:hypothetical protein